MSQWKKGQDTLWETEMSWRGWLHLRDGMRLQYFVSNWWGNEMEERDRWMGQEKIRYEKAMVMERWKARDRVSTGTHWSSISTCRRTASHRGWEFPSGKNTSMRNLGTCAEGWRDISIWNRDHRQIFIRLYLAYIYMDILILPPWENTQSQLWRLQYGRCHVFLRYSAYCQRFSSSLSILIAKEWEQARVL